MQNSRWSSLRWIHQLYRRQVTRRLIGLFCVGLATVILAFQILYFMVSVFHFGHAGINGLFILLSGLVLWVITNYFGGWGREGFRISTYFNRLEHNHPEIANRASLLVYTEKHRQEIERLGYSQELIHEDDQWLNRFISEKTPQNTAVLIQPVVTFFLLVTIPSLLFWTVKYDDFSQNLKRIHQALWVETTPPLQETIVTPSPLSVARGEPVILQARWSHPDPAKEVSIYIKSRKTWHRETVQQQGNLLTFVVPSANREMHFFFSAGDTVSNKGRVIPLDPPAIVQGKMDVHPPAYTGLQASTLDRLRPLAVPEGSRLSLRATASTSLRAATVSFAGKSFPTTFHNTTLEAELPSVMTSGDLAFEMIDIHGLKNRSRKYRITAIADATPTLKIFHPQQVTEMPPDMQLKVQLRGEDDYRVQRLYKHVEINGETSGNFSYMIWENTPASQKVQGVTNHLFVTYDWNIADYNLFPGDELSFWLELWDNDELHGPKSTRTQPFTILYPTLVDLISRLKQKEETQMEDLNTLVDSQREINDEVEKTLSKIAEKLEKREPESIEKDDSTWLEEKELETIKQKQEKLIEEARQIEDQLKEYQEMASQAVEQEDAQGFTPETLEKISRIQELMQTLMDEDSRNLMKKIDQTIDQLSQDISEKQLEELQFSFDDFEQQLDRTLTMLETAFQGRQLEGLRQMAQELAERQDHLENETQELARQAQELSQNPPADEAQRQAQQQALDNQQKQLQNRQKQMEDDGQTLMQSMKDLQQSLEPSRPEVAKQLQKMREQLQEKGLKNELSQATQQLKQGRFQQARQHQKNAQDQLASLAQAFQQQMLDMGMMNMQVDSLALQRLIRRGLFLSEQMEGLTESPLGRSHAVEALRKAKIFQRELARVEQNWFDIAKTNPFMGRGVQEFLKNSETRLRRAIEAGQGESWVGLHETRSSMVALNQAVYQMMQDMQQMQQQMTQSQSQSLQQQMQQMISEQQSLQQMLQQMRQMGESGQQMLDKMRQLAQQQQKIRKEIEKMMQKYRHAQQLKNRLDGIYQEMKEVEDLLKQGINDERVEEKQKRIMTRMLEAGTMQEDEDYGEDREEEIPKESVEAQSPDLKEPLTIPDKINKYVERPPVDIFPLPYREALKRYYIRLSEQVIP